MKSDLPRSFKEGDELTASLVNGILEEVWRWRKMEAMPPIYVSESDSAAPPIISFFQVPDGQIFAGTTGGGFAAGTPTSPTAVTTSCTIYLTEGTSGWTSAITTTTAYSIYSATIAASKTAYYWKSPKTNNYYILTADC